MKKLMKTLNKMKKAELVKLSRNLFILSLVTVIGMLFMSWWVTTLTVKISKLREEYKKQEVKVIYQEVQLRRYDEINRGLHEEIQRLDEELEDLQAEPTTWITLITVKEGDTLWDLAGEHLGNNFDWTKIYELNKDKIDNPDLIYPGQVLELPF